MHLRQPRAGQKLNVDDKTLYKIYLIENINTFIKIKTERKKNCMFKKKFIYHFLKEN